VHQLVLFATEPRCSQFLKRKLSKANTSKRNNNKIIMNIMWYVVFSYPWSLAWMFLCLMIGVKGGYLAGLYEPVPEELFWMDRILRRLFDGPPPTTPARRNNATPRPNNTSRPPRTKTNKTTTKAPPTPLESSESDNDDKTTVVEVAAAPEAEQQEVDLEAQTGTEAEQQLHDDGKN